MWWEGRERIGVGEGILRWEGNKGRRRREWSRGLKAVALEIEGRKRKIRN